MIHSLTGTVTHVGTHHIVVTLQGLGIELSVPRPQLYTPHQDVSLYTYFHWNQETGPHIFGFSTCAERDLFAWIITCQGIGPRLGMTILTHLSVIQCIEAIQHGNSETLSSVKGLGAKKAETLILHARNKHELLGAIAQQAAPLGQRTKNVVFDDVHQALQALKYSPTEVAPLLQQLHQDATLSQAPFDIVMRRALTLLSKGSRTV